MQRLERLQAAAKQQQQVQHPTGFPPLGFPPPGFPPGAVRISSTIRTSSYPALERTLGRRVPESRPGVCPVWLTESVSGVLSIMHARVLVSSAARYEGPVWLSAKLIIK